MADNYTPPQGRPQAVPPGLFDKLQEHPLAQAAKPAEPGLPPREEGEDLGLYQLRVNQWRRQNDPTYREAWDENKANGVRSSYQKAQVKALTECRKLNRTETRGIWTTNRVYARAQKLHPEVARHRLNRDSISKFRVDGVMCYLIAVNAPAPEAKPAPTTQRLGMDNPRPIIEEEPVPAPVATKPAPASPSPSPIGRVVTIQRITITRDEIEAHLLQLHGLKSGDFKWADDHTVVITTEA